MRSSFLLILIIFLSALIYLCTGITEPLNIQDEGNVLYSSVRILSGELPYRDFWTIYPPGQSLVIGALFSVFGRSILLTRFWDCLVRALIVVMVFIVSQRLMERKPALVVSILSCCWIGIDRIFSYNAMPALLLLLLSISTTGKSLLLSGILAGATLYFRIDFGAAAILAGLLAAFQEKRLATIRIFVTGLVPPALFLLITGYAAGGYQFFDQVFFFPLQGLPHHRFIPLQLMKLPSILLLLSIPVGFCAAYRNRAAAPLLAAFLFLVLCKFARFDFPHIQSILPLAFILSVSAAAQARLPVITALYCLVALGVPLVERFIPADNFQSPDQVHAVEFIKTATKPGEKIFSGAARHDNIFGNDISFYFLAERPAGTYYHELHPGTADSATVQEEIRNELDNNSVRYVVLYDGFRLKPSATEQRDSKLDNYFESMFDEVWREGDYSIRMRR